MVLRPVEFYTIALEKSDDVPLFVLPLKSNYWDFFSSLAFVFFIPGNFTNMPVANPPHSCLLVFCCCCYLFLFWFGLVFQYFVGSFSMKI